MGLSAAYIAFKDGREQDVLEYLNLKQVDELAAHHTMPFRDEMIMFETSTGWCIIGEGDPEGKIVAEQFLSMGSKRWQTIFASIAEHANFASCGEWMDGNEMWRITHELDIALDHVEHQGNLAPDIVSILEELTTEFKSLEPDELYDVFSSIAPDFFLERTGFGIFTKQVELSQPYSIAFQT